MSFRRFVTRALLAALALSIMSLSACHSIKRVDGPILEGRQFKVIKARATGTSYGLKLLGFIPIVHPNYTKATRQVYESTGISFEGRSVALANQTIERVGNYFIVFSVPRVTVAADVVEFVDPDPSLSVRPPS